MRPELLVVIVTLEDIISLCEDAMKMHPLDVGFRHSPLTDKEKIESAKDNFDIIKSHAQWILNEIKKETEV